MAWRRHQPRAKGASLRQPSLVCQPPPCREYKDLRTIADLLEMAANYEEVETMEELKDISAQLTVLKNCMRGLFASWKSSVTELEKALQGWRAANEQSEKDAAKAKAAQAKWT